MPRRPRIHLDNLPVHIVQKGRHGKPASSARKTTKAICTGWVKRSPRPNARCTPMY